MAATTLNPRSAEERFTLIEGRLEAIAKDTEDYRRRQDVFEGKVERMFGDLAASINLLGERWNERRDADRQSIEEKIAARDEVAKSEAKANALTWTKIIGGASAVCGPILIIGGIGWWSLGSSILLQVQPLDQRIRNIEAVIPATSARRDQQVSEIKSQIESVSQELRSRQDRILDRVNSDKGEDNGRLSKLEAESASNKQSLIEVETQFRTFDQLLNFRLDHVWSIVCANWRADTACPRPQVLEQRIGRDARTQ